jgi:hypothetical protein
MDKYISAIVDKLLATAQLNELALFIKRKQREFNDTKDRYIIYAKTIGILFFMTWLLLVATLVKVLLFMH